MPAAKRSNGSAKANKVITADFEQDRETKNAYRFAEILAKGQDRGVVGSIYVLKSALEAAKIDPANVLTVTITEADEEE